MKPSLLPRMLALASVAVLAGSAGAEEPDAPVLVNFGNTTNATATAGVAFNHVVSNGIVSSFGPVALVDAGGGATGLAIRGSGQGFGFTGTLGNFSPVGSTVYTGGNAVIDGWISGIQTDYGNLWQGGVNSASGGYNSTVTLSGFQPSTTYRLTLLSARGNSFLTQNGSYRLSYGGSEAGIGTSLTGSGEVSGSTVTGSAQGSAAGLNARGIEWIFRTGEIPQNAVITLTGEWNMNALLLQGNVRSPTPLLISSFTASPSYLPPGSTTTLSWQVSGADAVEISPGIGTVTGNQTTVSPAATTTYTLTASRGPETRTASLRVGVGPPRPNILLVLTDDQGVMDTSVPFVHDADGNPVIHPLNQRYRTPGMETLAANGVKFTNAHAATVCSPSRTSIMTGLNPTRHHVTTWTAAATPASTGPDKGYGILEAPGWLKAGADPSHPQMLPRMLANAGYRTIHVGKGHFGPNSVAASDPRSLGFDVNVGGSGIGHPGSYSGTSHFGSGTYQVPHLQAYHGREIFLTEALTRECNRLIEEAVAAGMPFFAYHAHYAPHAPFQEDPRFSANYPGLSGNPRAYATLIEGCDQSLRDQLAKLEELGVAESTLVIYAGDNGSDAPVALNAGQIGSSAPYRAKKGHPYDGGSRVPLLVAWAKPDPSHPLQQALPIPQGSVTHDMVSIWDFYPTILAAAGLEIPAAIDGHSLLPYLRGEPGTHRPQEYLLHFPHTHGYDDFHSILRTDEWKLIHRYPNSSNELYHLPTDIGEQNNLADHPSHQKTLMRLSRRMARGLRELQYQPPVERHLAGNPQRPMLTPSLPDVDSDGDGIPDLQEDITRNGRVEAGETDADNPDSDADGTPDGTERRIGTDPLDPARSFRMRLESAPPYLRLAWPSLPGSSFTVRQSENLLDWSETLVTGHPADPAPATETVVQLPHPGEGVPSKTRFFRVELDP